MSKRYTPYTRKVSMNIEFVNVYKTIHKEPLTGREYIYYTLSAFRLPSENNTNFRAEISKSDADKMTEEQFWQFEKEIIQSLWARLGRWVATEGRERMESI
jgi:hypothetical protein